MTTPTPQTPRKIVVIGGGISGLAAANRVVELAHERRLPCEVLLLEASDALGGTIHTQRRNGFLLEHGPDSFITDKPWAWALCRRLGLDDRLIGTDQTHRRSFVAWKGRLLAVPAGFHLLAPADLRSSITSPILSVPGKLRVLLEAFLPPRPKEGDESLAGFVERRLGREALERVAQPMIAGIYGADPRTLSLAATMPRFLEMERTHGSVIRALRARQANGKRLAGHRPPSASDSQRKGSSVQSAEEREDRSAGAGHAGVSGARYDLFMSLREGMGALVDALAARLPEASVRRSSRAAGLARTESGHWRIALADKRGAVDGASLEADAVCLAVPAYQAAALLRPIEPSLADQLEAIRYAPAGTLNLAFRREHILHPLHGFGFVVPASEGQMLLGCTFSSVKFPGRAPDGHALLRAFLGERGLSCGDEGEITAAVQAELSALLGISAPPLFTTLWRHERAMPQYELGHLDRVAVIEVAVTRLPRLALAGNAYRGIGIPDAVHSGEQAAEQLMGV